MKRGFVTPLRVESIGPKTWKLLEDFVWIGSKDDVFTIPAGDITDFATTPWWTQAILPKTGTWSKSAVVHDRMCNDQRLFYQDQKERSVSVSVQVQRPRFPKPIFTSIDTDAIFRKNAREEGTDPIRAELLWFGVRCGSLYDAHRRDKWVRTSPRFIFDLLWILGALVAIVAGISWAWPW